MNNRDEKDLQMRTIDLDALHIFRTVAEQGGITRAAAKLNRVQSNVTTRVKQLEERLGTQLFVRERRRLTLSPEGRLLLVYADELLRLSSEAQAAMRSGTPRGVFRIGTLESTAAARLPPILARYHRAYPEVQIELVTGTSGALVARLHAYEIEAAFVAEPFTVEGLETRRAFDEELVVISPRGTAPVARGARGIGRRTVIAFAVGCSYRRRLEEWLAADGVVPSQVMEFGSYHAIIACVCAGAGIAVVPRSVLRLAGAERQVNVGTLPSRTARARTMLAWRRGHRSIALEALKTAVM
jgi:DNA-binding transcriptional LysR family regulator